MNDALPDVLAAKLAGPLPGEKAGLFYQPHPSAGSHYRDWPADARRAAVLVLVYPHHGEWVVPLTVRPTHLPDHPGQICLPGGAVEVNESGRDAALRELREELGDWNLELRWLGRLSTLYVRASHYCVEPWVAASSGHPSWQPNPAEVAEVIDVPLRFILDPNQLVYKQFRGFAWNYLAPCFDWRGYRIWGATCMMLGELIYLLEGVPIDR